MARMLSWTWPGPHFLYAWATKLRPLAEWADVVRAADKAKSDGVVTAQQKKRLTKAQNKTSRHIYRQKHDAQQRPGS